MKYLKTLGIIALLGVGAAAAPTVMAQNHGGGGHFSGGGGAHFSGGGGGGAHFSGSRGFSGGGARFSGGARTGYAGVPRAGYYRPGISDHSGLRFTPRTSYSGYNGYRGGYGRYANAYGHVWRGGYWGGRYWPGAGYRTGFSWFLPTLPLGFATYWWGGLPYYYYGDSYYTWSPYYSGYVATDPPPVADRNNDAADAAQSDDGSDAVPPGVSQENPEVFAYPKNGQSNEQAAKDRDECRSWAAGESGYDTTHVTPSGKGSVADFQRAMGACLDARGYSTR